MKETVIAHELTRETLQRRIQPRTDTCMRPDREGLTAGRRIRHIDKPEKKGPIETDTDTEKAPGKTQHALPRKTRASQGPRALRQRQLCHLGRGTERAPPQDPERGKGVHSPDHSAGSSSHVGEAGGETGARVGKEAVKVTPRVDDVIGSM